MTRKVEDTIIAIGEQKNQCGNTQIRSKDLYSVLCMFRIKQDIEEFGEYQSKKPLDELDPTSGNFKAVSRLTQRKRDKELLEMIKYGLHPGRGSKSLLPISQHRSEVVFSTNALAKACRIENDVWEKKDTKVYERAHQLRSEMSAGLTVEGSPPYLGEMLSASVGANFSFDKSTEMTSSFGEEYKIYHLYSTRLPNATQKLRNLATREFLEAIDAVSTRDQARRFLDTYGTGFITSVSWGGKISLTTKSHYSRQGFEKHITTKLKARMNMIFASGGAAANMTQGWKTFEDEKGESTNLQVIGGQPHLISNYKAWQESCIDYPNVIMFKVGSISSFSKESNNGKKYLDEAIELVCRLEKNAFEQGMLLQRQIQVTLENHPNIELTKKEGDRREIAIIDKSETLKELFSKLQKKKKAWARDTLTYLKILVPRKISNISLSFWNAETNTMLIYTNKNGLSLSNRIVSRQMHKSEGQRAAFRIIPTQNKLFGLYSEAGNCLLGEKRGIIKALSSNEQDYFTKYGFKLELRDGEGKDFYFLQGSSYLKVTPQESYPTSYIHNATAFRIQVLVG